MGNGTKLGLVAATLALACVCVFILVAKPFSAQPASAERLSPEAALYLDDAMLTLKKATVAYQMADDARATRLYRSVLPVMPVENAADEAVESAYLEYANNVRYYMVGDGSCTLKQLEDSRAKAEAAIAANQ